MSDEERENEIHDTSEHINKSLDTPHDDTHSEDEDGNKKKRWEELYKLVRNPLLISEYHNFTLIE